MSEKSKLNKVADDDLEEVVSGYGRIVDKGNGNYEFWFQCSACAEYAELINTGNTSIECIETGTFVCPKCGWRKSYTLECNSDGVRVYGPVG